MFDHPQVIAEDMLAHFTHPVLGSYRGFTRAIRFERTPGPDPFAAPTLGQHTEAMRAVAPTGACGAGPWRFRPAPASRAPPLQRPASTLRLQIGKPDRAQAPLWRRGRFGIGGCRRVGR